MKKRIKILLLAFGGVAIALFMLLYMLASRLIPLVPVWEVQEGQSAHILRKVGKAVIPTVSNVD